MKKTLILTTIVLAIATHAMAQVDTLWVGDRVPNYYYWDTNWWDHYYLNYEPKVTAHLYPGNPHINFGCGGGMGGTTDETCKVERARYFYTDTAMRIIGVAAMIGISDNATASELNYPEYFRLYEVGLKGMEDSMVFVAEARWDTNEISHYMQAEANWRPHPTYDPIDVVYYEDRDVYPIYEAYFDSAVWVTDSFYLSGTKNNVFKTWEVHYGTAFGIDYIDTLKYSNRPYAIILGPGCSHTSETNAQEIWLKPQNHRYKAHLIDPGNRQFTDTLWHLYRIKSFSAIFPIFDTCPYCTIPITDDSCAVPQHLRAGVSQLTSGIVTLMWDNNGNDSLWEVSLCREGCQPDDGDITQSTSSFLCIEGLDTAQWYSAWVRTVCDSTISDWSDSIRFYIPGQNQQGNEEVTTVLDRFTSLTPNPAQNQVTIISSFILRSVEIYSMNGTLITQQKVKNKITTTIPLDKLASGTYIVRINTTNGTIYKKLIVK